MKNKKNSHLEKKTVETIWLNYFNQYLFECGSITAREYKKMIELIAKFSNK